MGGTRGENHGVSFLFPPSSGLSPNYLDTINITYTSPFPSPLLYTFCVNASNPKDNDQVRLDKVDPYNGTLSVLLDFENVSTCYWNLRPNTTLGNGANGEIITLVPTTRSPAPTTYGLLQSEPSSTSSTILSTASPTTAPITTSGTSSGTQSATPTAIPTINGLQSETSSTISATPSVTASAISSATTSPPPPDTHDSLSAGAGIAIGAVVLGAALTAFIFWFVSRRRRQRSTPNPEIVYEKPHGGSVIESYSSTRSYPSSITTQPPVEVEPVEIFSPDNKNYISEMGVSEPARVELDSRSVFVAELGPGKARNEPPGLDEMQEGKTRDETMHWKIRRQDFHFFMKP